MAMLSQVLDDSFCSGIFIPKPVHKVNTGMGLMAHVALSRAIFEQGSIGGGAYWRERCLSWCIPPQPH